jgi:hypothetical protein
MPRVGFEPTVPVPVRAKRVHALDCATTVTDQFYLYPLLNLSLCIIKHCTMKAYVRLDVYIHVFLSLAPVGGVWSASRSTALHSGKEPALTHWTGDWVGLRTGLDDMENRKISLLPGLEIRPLCHPAHRQSLYRLLNILHYQGFVKDNCFTSIFLLSNETYTCVCLNMPPLFQ